jgi:hypothetical protein
MSPPNWENLMGFYRRYIENQATFRSEKELRLERENANVMIGLMSDMSREPELQDIRIRIEYYIAYITVDRASKEIHIIGGRDGVSICMNDEQTGEEIPGSRSTVSKREAVSVVLNMVRMLKVSAVQA